MQTGRASETAVLAALQRAAHPLLDSAPWIFKDDLAAAFCGLPDAAAVRAAIDTMERELARMAPPTLAKSWLQTARLSVALRSRYTEDELGKAIERGVSQYVILGAGHDSFAYRRRDLVGRLRIFEVDHPATQQQKQARLGELRIEAPSHVTFVPLDFEQGRQQSILGALQDMGYRREEPAFFSWLGVATYLTGEAIDATLAQIASAGHGSEIVLNYLMPIAFADAQEQELLRMLESQTAARGEPVRSYFEPAQLEQRMRALGFADIWHFGADDAHARYLADRTDGLRISRLVRLLKARVGRS